MFTAPQKNRSRISSDARDTRVANLPGCNEPAEWNDHGWPPDATMIDDSLVDEPPFVDDPEFAEGFGLPINTLTEDDLRFLRDFILSSAMYVEQLEAFLCDSSDDFWEAREQAYRIITALLIRHYEYELEG
jgi:hypothetical protein